MELLTNELRTIAKTHIKIAIHVAVDFLIFPLGKGLFFFMGCNLSFSISFISLIIYIKEDAKLNAKKAPMQSSTLWQETNPEQTSGIKIKIFLIQCFILISFR